MLEACGEISVRGKGGMRTWLLLDRGVGVAVVPPTAGTPAMSPRGSRGMLGGPGAGEAAGAI